VNAVLLALLVARRLQLTRRHRRREQVEAELRPAIVAFIDAGDPLPAGLDVYEQEVLAELLAGYAQLLRGPARERITAYFEEEGAVERQFAWLASKRPLDRAAAAHRLGIMRSRRAVGALVAALDDPDRTVRIAVAASLGRLGAPEAAEALLGTLARGTTPALLTRWAILQAGPAVTDSLRTQLGGPEPEERAGAVQLLGLLGSPADAEGLVERLRDSSALVREQAALALGRLGGPQSLAPLRAAIRDRIPAVRAAAAVALGRLRDAEAFPALIEQACLDRFEPARAAAHAAALVDPEALAGEARDTRNPHLREAADVAGLR
jgi:HEAT repeat protein